MTVFGMPLLELIVLGGGAIASFVALRSQLVAHERLDDQRFAEVEKRFGAVEKRFDEQDKMLTEIRTDVKALLQRNK